MNWQINSLLQNAINNFKRNNFIEAKILLLKILDIEPKNFDALNIIGVIYGNENDHLKALNFFKKAQKIRPDFNLINFNLAKSFSEIGNDLEAIKYYETAIKLDKNHLGSLLNFGKSLHQLKRYDEALSHYDQAIKLKPDFVDAYNNKGVTLNNLKRYDEALSHYDQAIKLKPDFIDAYNNKGITLNNLKRYDEALSHYDQAIKLKPDFIDAYYNKGITKLCLGDFEQGWSLYKYRWKRDFEGYRYCDSKLLENVNDLKNKKILVWHEQGLGDTIMFSRYVNQLIDIGAVVIFEVQQDLEFFFRSQFKCKIVNKVSPTEFFDFQVPLLNLPKLFNTSLDNIPFNRFYLKVEHKKKKEWEKKLQLSKNKFNVGISISGNKSHKKNHIRSLPLKKMEPFFDKVNLFIIQKELCVEDMKFLNNHKEINFLGKEINNFSDTAAIVENMDLIISVDTSLIHLAGALGKKSFLMLSYSADWRWLLERNSSPWYDSVKIFRQKLIGDWNFVINEIQLEFNNLKLKFNI
jgi:Tfp pilus assembly protein PilF